MLRRLVWIFIIAFILNFIWEEAHSQFYIHYKGSPVTHSILLHAAFFDAAVTTLAGGAFLRFLWLRNRTWLVLVIGFIFAVGLERFALATGRWAYTTQMPIIPFLGVGLTPALQLGLLGYATIRTVLILLEK